MKRLVVCGCSFMTTSFHKYNQLKGTNWPDFPSTSEEYKNLPKSVIKELNKFNYFKHHRPSFIDTFVKTKKYDYINLSTGGAGNFSIRIQIEQALKFKPDYVIVGASEFTRFDLTRLPYDHNKLLRNFNNKKPELMGDLQGVLSTIGSEDKNPYLWLSDLPRNERTVFLKLIDLERKRINDYYILQNGLDLLRRKSIPYVFLPGPLKMLDWSDYDIVWPNTEEQPWDKFEFSIGNHRSLESHETFYKTLINLTKNWE